LLREVPELERSRLPQGENRPFEPDTCGAATSQLQPVLERVLQSHRRNH
jgi:hypothetical protein